MTEKPTEPTPTPTGPTPGPTQPYPGPTPNPTLPTPGPSMGPDPHIHNWEDSQRMMLKGMTPEQKADYFRSTPEQQNAAVQDWHQQNFGTNTSTDMPKGGSMVDGNAVGWEGGRPKGS